MTDVREQIMARLEEIAAAVPGILHVARNVVRASDAENPAIYLLEGDELTNEEDLKGRRGMGPRRVTMTPQVIIKRIRSSNEVGPDLNTLRLATINAVLSDAQLQNLTLNKQGVGYDGMETDLAFGRQMVGHMALRFRMTFVMRFN